MKGQPNIFDRANGYIRDTEASLVNLLSAIAPWGAPLIPATMTYKGMMDVLKFGKEMAFVGAGIVEILGLATISTALGFWQNNRSPRVAAYKKMPVEIPVICFVWYLLVVLVVNVLLEAPWQAGEQIYVNLVARALLTTLSIPAAVTLAIRTIHHAALKGYQPVTEQLQEQPKLSPVKEGEKKVVTRAITSNERRATLHSLIEKGDRPNVTELAKTWGVSRKTVYGDIAYVTSDGNGYHQEQEG